MRIYDSNSEDIFMRWKMECFNEAKPSWMQHPTFHQMKIFLLLHKWKHLLLVLHDTDIDLLLLNHLPSKQFVFINNDLIGHSIRIRD